MIRTSLASLFCLLLGTGFIAAQERDLMPWVRDYREATETAARERKLVLIHFWADDCLPCRRVEANVFSREEVAGAVKAAFVPLKVHVEQSPELARYQITRWPTDVIVTPAGLEVYRTVSPQEPIKYVAMLSEVTRQSGSALASNLQQSVNNVQQSVNQTVNQSVSNAQQAVNGAAHGMENALTSAIQKQIGPYAAAPTPTTPPAANPASNPPVAQEMANPYVLGGKAGASTQQPPTAKSEYAGEYGGSSYGGDGSIYGEPSTAQLPSPPKFNDTPIAQSPPADQNASVPTTTTNSTANGLPALPPLGMDGYCVITLEQENAWKKGDKKFGAIHRGKLYLFASAEHQQKFLAEPDRFSPVLSGFDPVLFLEQGNLVDGKREFGIKDKQIYLFSSAESRKKFEADPARYMQSVQQAMLRVDAGLKLR